MVHSKERLNEKGDSGTQNAAKRWWRSRAMHYENLSIMTAKTLNQAKQQLAQRENQIKDLLYILELYKNKQKDEIMVDEEQLKKNAQKPLKNIDQILEPIEKSLDSDHLMLNQNSSNGYSFADYWKQKYLNLEASMPQLQTPTLDNGDSDDFGRLDIRAEKATKYITTVYNQTVYYLQKNKRELFLIAQDDKKADWKQNYLQLKSENQERLRALETFKKQNTELADEIEKEKVKSLEVEKKNEHLEKEMADSKQNFDSSDASSKQQIQSMMQMIDSQKEVIKEMTETYTTTKRDYDLRLSQTEEAAQEMSGELKGQITNLEKELGTNVFLLKDQIFRLRKKIDKIQSEGAVLIESENVSASQVLFVKNENGLSDSETARFNCPDLDALEKSIQNMERFIQKRLNHFPSKQDPLLESALKSTILERLLASKKILKEINYLSDHEKEEIHLYLEYVKDLVDMFGTPHHHHSREMNIMMKEQSPHLLRLYSLMVRIMSAFLHSVHLRTFKIEMV